MIRKEFKKFFAAIRIMKRNNGIKEKRKFYSERFDEAKVYIQGKDARLQWKVYMQMNNFPYFFKVCDYWAFKIVNQDDGRSVHAELDLNR